MLEEPPSKRTRRSASRGEAARTSQAYLTPTSTESFGETEHCRCTSCRERKIKCSGIQPCRYCLKRQLECIFPENVRKKMYSVAYVEDLERLVSSIEGRENSNIAIQPERSTVPSSLSPVDQEELTETGESSQASPILMDSTMSSSIHFGSRIRGLPTNINTSIQIAASLPTESPDNVYNLEPDGSKVLHNIGNIDWPSEEQAHDLLNTVLASIGRVQHLIDPRAFSDRLSSFYDGFPAQNVSDDLWYVEMLMVFSLGGLLQGKLKEGSSFPGAEYFLGAINRLPSLCTLRNADTLAVEIMGLFAFFLQCSDRKDDAYVYAGVALRLALSNGLARDKTTQAMPRSQKTHRNRLWWTIYMQERRLAAATGNPIGVSDDDITVPLPTDSPGFYSTMALNLNIQIARITGKIIQSVYSHKPTSERRYLRRVQDILSELAQIWKSMPSEYTLDFSQPLTVTRTGATLHLMLFQAMALTTRPILLHLATSKSNSMNIDALLADKSPLQKLSATCIEAAGRSLDVLLALRQQGLLAKFGFFDLDASVSSAFVFVLVEIVYSEKKPGAGVQGIGGAMHILRYLSQSGNKAATKRLVDVEQMCEHLDIALHSSVERLSVGRCDHSPQRATPTVPLEATPGLSNTGPPELDLPGTTISMEPIEGTDWRLSLSLPHTSLDYLEGMDMNNHDFNDMNLDDFNLDFGGNFMFTGADSTDWEEFERQIAQPS